MKKIALTADEASMLAKMSVEELREMAKLKESGKLFEVILNVVNRVIDTEKNYAFHLREDEHFASNHAYSRGKAAFGVQFMRLLTASSLELARREKIQEELKQQKQHE